jgi:adenylyltransferase/sulfurtransferase
VSATNLHRQILFDVSNLGELKVEAAARRLKQTNPFVQVEAIAQHADAEFLANLVPHYDVVVDGTDNFFTKYAINDACETNNRPLVYGSIFQFEGHVSVFHLDALTNSVRYSYRDLYPSAPPSGLTQNCGEAGVIGVLPGIVGTLQANEVIKLITGLGRPLVGTLLVFDALAGSMQSMALKKRIAQAKDVFVETTSEIPFEELATRLASFAPPLLLDVRDNHERLSGSLGGIHIPLIELASRLDEVPHVGEVVVYCKSGVRSGRAALYLQSVRPSLVIRSLQGGVDGASCGLLA